MELASSIRCLSAAVKVGNPIGNWSDLRARGPPLRICRALEQVPQTGAMCTQTRSGDSNQWYNKARSLGLRMSNTKMVDLAPLLRILSSASETCIPNCFATEHNVAVPLYSSIMKHWLSKVSAQFFGHRQELFLGCALSPCDWRHFDSPHRCQPLGHRSPSLA